MIVVFFFIAHGGLYELLRLYEDPGTRKGRNWAIQSRFYFTDQIVDRSSLVSKALT